jgi:hypothetical protein
LFNAQVIFQQFKIILKLVMQLRHQLFNIHHSKSCFCSKFSQVPELSFETYYGNPTIDHRHCSRGHIKTKAIPVTGRGVL